MPRPTGQQPQSLHVQGATKKVTGEGRSSSGASLGAQAELLIPPVSGVTRIRFGEAEWCDIILDVAEGTVTLDRTHASEDDRAHDGSAVAENAFDGSAASGVRVFLDGSVIEVFTPSGRTLTSRVYPLAAPPWHVEAPDGVIVWDLIRSVTASAVAVSCGAPTAVNEA